VTELKRPSLVKPSLQTRFHIDFDWWRKERRDWRLSEWALCPEHQVAFAELNGDNMVDWVIGYCRGAARRRLQHV
jgi:hypothetical protein